MKFIKFNKHGLPILDVGKPRQRKISDDAKQRKFDKKSEEILRQQAIRQAQRSYSNIQTRRQHEAIQ